MYEFNSLQITAIFAAWPFLLSWLAVGDRFPGQQAAFWVALIAYLVGFVAMVRAVYIAIVPEKYL